jgi:hypothetical protein
MTIDSAGNVGIGKTTPNSILDINGLTIITGSCAIRGGLGLGNVSPYSSANRFIFDNDYNDSARGPNKIQLYDSGFLAGFGVHSNTVSYYSGVDHSWYQATNATNATILMTANTTGLSVGKSNPNAKLDVNGNAIVTGSLYISGGANYVQIGGFPNANAYNSTTGAKLLFGGSDADALGNYYIGTNQENYGGNYNKLDLRWHTGIRMGAQPGYGGIRFYDSEDLGTVIFSVGQDDANVRVKNSLSVGKVTAPNAPLDVNGNTIISGSLIVTGDVQADYTPHFLLMGA